MKDAYIDDMFSLWDCNKQEINLFIEQANSFYPTVKLTAEISENETTFLVITNYKGERLKNESILDIRTHYKPTETLYPIYIHRSQFRQYTVCSYSNGTEKSTKKSCLWSRYTNHQCITFINFKNILIQTGI